MTCSHPTQAVAYALLPRNGKGELYLFKGDQHMQRQIRMAIAAAAFLSLGASLALAAQPAPQPPADQPGARFQGQTNVNEVLLDVLVTDKRGNVIVGLNKNDF